MQDAKTGQQGRTESGTGQDAAKNESAEDPQESLVQEPVLVPVAAWKPEEGDRVRVNDDFYDPKYRNATGTITEKKGGGWCDIVFDPPVDSSEPLASKSLRKNSFAPINL